MPNRPDGDREQDHVRNHVDHTGDHEVELGVDAVARQRCVPSFGDRAALEGDRHVICEVEGDVEPQRHLDEPEDRAAHLCRHEDALQLEQDRELGGEDGRAIEEPVDEDNLFAESTSDTCGRSAVLEKVCLPAIVT